MARQCADDLSLAGQDAKQGITHIPRVVRNLKGLTTNGPDQLISVAKVVRTAISLSRHRIQRKATITVEEDGECWILADESQLCQVLINLLINAADSIPNDVNGAITIGIAQQNEQVCISVGDNGSGMSSEVQSKIFDMFYTTKSQALGTGLGLPLSREIIERMDGELRVTSTLNEGSIFSITLPISGREDTIPQSIMREPTETLRKISLLMTICCCCVECNARCRDASLCTLPPLKKGLDLVAISERGSDCV